MSVRKELAEFIGRLTYEDLPPQVVREVKLSILDALGAMFIGYDTELGKTTVKMADVHPQGKASVIVTGEKAELLSAIQANCAVAHCAEIDDIHPKAVTCIGGMVIPGLLAFAEAEGYDGKQLIEGVAAGYETAIRLGKSVKGEQLLAKGWWPSSIFGPLGLCAGICKLRDHSPEITEEALAINSTICGGLINGGAEGATARHFLYGWSAQGAAMAVKAAESGFTGPVFGIEKDKGLFTSRAVETDFSGLTDDLGEAFHLSEMFCKEFACAMQIQSGVHGFLKLLSDHGIEKEEIARVELKLPQRALVVISSRGIPESHTAAAAHGPYIIAAAAKYKELLPAQFGDDMLTDEEMHRFMDRITVEADQVLDGYTGYWPARVKIITKSGRVFENETISWMGENPSEKSEFYLTKFRRTMSGLLPAGKIEEILLAVDRLEEFQDINTFINLIKR